jgi:hypothetical protein
MKNLTPFDAFVNEAKKVDPKKGYTISNKVQSSIKKLCESMLHDEACEHDANDDKAQTYEGYMKECGNYMNECMNECTEIYRSGGKFTNR